MTYPAVTFPDAELLIGVWLRAALPGNRVVTDLPANFEQVLPVVQVTRIGGARTQQVLDNPRIDLDCFAATREAAADLARQVEALLPTARGVTASGGVVGWVGVEVGASWRPDFNPRVRRYGLTAQLVIRPA